ncbi:sh3 type 3 domain protein [Leptolyngbya sp. Heron Island J]|uniref:hypothetical protein n=1 Tax=Leptolyngbya sp. Heron Island J TaxID=1385935 RepID=UPI0003B9AEC7|nr:hypothetical protein [Leptolyngbya sp. Heron Island J]ESA33812.1 sh3 type 3 domain protein [Leptolyngbya sp. Heron Island J]
MKHFPIAFVITGSLISAISLASCSNAIPSDSSNNDLAQAYDCQTMVVDDPDGFVNIRTSAQVSKNNLVMSLLNGTEINAVYQQSDWIQIDAPVQGWVARDRTAICCASYSHHLMASKVQVIRELGQRATSEDSQAAESLFKLWVDGAFAEAQAVALARWAGENPQFLISVLGPQDQALRQEILEILDYGFGEEMPQARQNFEVALDQLPVNHPIVQEWFDRK